MKEELALRNIHFISEFRIPVEYKGKPPEVDFRCDLFLENAIVLEIKAVNELKPVFEAQLLTYMKLLKTPKGILINFNCSHIFKEGQKTFVNEYFSKLPDR